MTAANFVSFLLVWIVAVTQGQAAPFLPFPITFRKPNPMSSPYTWDLKQELSYKTYLGEWTPNCMVVYPRSLAWLERDIKGSGSVRLIKYADELEPPAEYTNNSHYHYFQEYVRDIRPGKGETLWCRPSSTFYFSSNDNKIINGTSDGNYLPGRETVWMISFPQPTDITLILKNIHLENSESCKNDYVSFYSSDLEHKTVAQFYCSKLETDPPHTVFYNVTNFTIKFQANEHLEFGGFNGALVVLNTTAVHSPQTEKRSTRSIKKNKDNDFDKFKLNNLDPLAEKDDDDSLQEEIKPSVEYMDVVDCVASIVKDGMRAIEKLEGHHTCDEAIATYLEYLSFSNN